MKLEHLIWFLLMVLVLQNMTIQIHLIKITKAMVVLQDYELNKDQVIR